MKSDIRDAEAGMLTASRTIAIDFLYLDLDGRIADYECRASSCGHCTADPK